MLLNEMSSFLSVFKGVVQHIRRLLSSPLGQGPNIQIFPVFLQMEELVNYVSNLHPSQQNRPYLVS